MNWKLPNQLTIARIILAAVFFVLLGLYERGGSSGRWLLNAAFVVYIIAGITDVLDGHIARKYNWTSAFGRISDPFVDKVLVVGAFAMLAGSNFAMPGAISIQAPYLDVNIGHVSRFEWELPRWLSGHMLSAVQAWMVVVIMSRELVVSAVRGYSESQGIDFPATPAGKIKMFVQSLAICVVLYQQANIPDAAWAVVVKVAAVWLAVITTVLSGLAYVGKARRVMILQDEHVA